MSYGLLLLFKNVKFINNGGFLDPLPTACNKGKFSLTYSSSLKYVN